MGGQANGRAGRARGVVIAVALAFAVPLLAPTGAQGAAIVGGGAIHGTVDFDSPGLPTGACVNDTGFDVNGFAPSVVYNTVITGFVGALRLSGRGNSECEAATEITRNGSLNPLTATGTGPTGSRLDCATLSGTFNRIGTVVSVRVNGDCIVNSYRLERVNFDAVLQFTPRETAEVNGSIHVTKAFFDGAFTLSPVLD